MEHNPELEQLLHLTSLIVQGMEVDKAKLSAAVAALRKQRATTLAESLAYVEKANRQYSPSNDPSSYAPVTLVISLPEGKLRIRIGDTVNADPIADRLALCWNACTGVPNEELLPYRMKPART